MTRPDEVWIPLVDEPIGTIVAQIQADHAEIGQLVASPQRLLAFKTFAYIRVGLVLGELLVENDIEPYNGSQTWIEQLLANPEYRARVVEEVQTVAEEVARDIPPDAPMGPDEAARERFRDFARRQLEQS
ncbi:MAG TPA: hypothetical protein VEL10_00450 [Gaiellaceae bacterium]|nr:hypothetical protein [Gaiellaceae bacterium]